MQKVLRVASSVALAVLAGAIVGPALVFLLDFTLSLAHDLYMDAESNTIFNQLGWLDAVITGMREALGFDEGDWRTILKRVLRLLAIVVLVSLPFSWAVYWRNERRTARRQARR